MMDGSKETPIPKEPIKGREGLLKAAREFKWLNPEKKELVYKTNYEVIEESVEVLREAGLVEDVTDLMEWVVDIRNQANTIYKKIYPKGMPHTVGDYEHALHGDFEKEVEIEEGKKEPVLDQPYFHGIEPYYHGIGTENDWYGHNDYVMAAAARLFSSLVELKKRRVDKGLSKELDSFFGEGWQDQELALNDFKALMAMAAFHEVGEWWIKTYWKGGLAEQRKQFDEQIRKGVDIKDIKITHLKDLVSEEEVSEGTGRMEKIIDQMENIFSSEPELTLKVVTNDEEAARLTEYEPGLVIEYDHEEEATEFSVYFMGGEKEDVAFAPKKAPEATGQKPFILARLFKAADFFQCFSPEYFEKVNYTSEGRVTTEKSLGHLVLYEDFYAFKVGALPSFGWPEPKDVGIGEYYYEKFLMPNVGSVLPILDQFFGSPEQNPYRQSLNIIEKDITDE